ncbi:MAG: rod shape-determining protein MreC [Oscillospiraceae bacterium]|nr:rod shape-determining protein MreC [Oscillospiraceae bacterium]
MRNYLKNKGLRFGLIVILVAAFTLLSLNARGGRAGFLSDVSGAIKQPLQQAAFSVAGWLEGLYGYLYDYERLAAEVESLRIQLADAQERAKLGAEALEENTRLRELLNLKERNQDFIFESAKIVSWNPTNWSSSFTINKGSGSGINTGDCVITEYGAVAGQVIEIGNTWATVRTVTDVDIYIGASVGDSGGVAMIIGEFTLMHEGYIKLAHLAEGLQLFKGDDVYTSGMGDVFPSGLKIGTVAEVLTEAGGQTPYGIVEPACDLNKLVQVFVLKKPE